MNPSLLSAGIRLLLLFGCLLTFFFVIHYIRKSRVRIEDTLFWIIFCLLLTILAVFPEIPFFFSNLLEIQSPINFVYLFIIFILIVNQFYMSLRISQLQIKTKELVQRVALDRTDSAPCAKDEPLE